MRRSIAFLVVGLILGGVVATTLSAPTTADAATGDNLVMGQKNYASNITKIIARYGLLIDVRKVNSPALVLYTKGGVAPPMKVNSTTKVTNLNADLLDGNDTADLRPLAAWCSNDDAPDGADYSCSTSITLPTAGHLLMSASMEIFNTSTDTDDTVYCSIKIDNTRIDHSDRDIDVPFAGNVDHTLCVTDAHAPRPAGTYDIAFAVEGVAALTHIQSVGMTVLFVPNP